MLVGGSGGAYWRSVWFYRSTDLSTVSLPSSSMLDAGCMQMQVDANNGHPY